MGLTAAKLLVVLSRKMQSQVAAHPSRSAPKRAATLSYRPKRRCIHFQAAKTSAPLHQVNGASKHNTDHDSSRRRLLLSLPLTLSLVSNAGKSLALVIPPNGYRLHVDKLDGYSFFYPEDWLPVTSAGNDVFYRNIYNIDENLFVNTSSPSSSRYKSVEDLGTPEEAAKKILDQYLNQEFMSSRIGIKREGSVVSASSRTGPNGTLYYDIDIRMTSYGSRNPYVATNAEVMKDYGLEWDRILSTTLGVANQRLYEFRLQTSKANFESVSNVYKQIRDSFVCKEVDK